MKLKPEQLKEQLGEQPPGQRAAPPPGAAGPRVSDFRRRAPADQRGCRPATRRRHRRGSKSGNPTSSNAASAGTRYRRPSATFHFFPRASWSRSACPRRHPATKAPEAMRQLAGRPATATRRGDRHPGADTQGRGVGLGERARQRRRLGGNPHPAWRNCPSGSPGVSAPPA